MPQYKFFLFRLSLPFLCSTLRQVNFSYGPRCMIWRRYEMETFFALLALCAGNSPVIGEFPHEGQWRGALTFSSIYAWINSWVNTREAGDLSLVMKYPGIYRLLLMSQAVRCKRFKFIPIKNLILYGLVSPFVNSYQHIFRWKIVVW